jgi:arabinofuranosyltransferase
MSRSRALVALAALALLWVTLRSAWISDDAFITLRHLEHLALGHGLRFNVAERVQGFTHPLWALALLPGHLLTRDPFHGPLVLSVVASMGAAAWLVRQATTPLHAVAGLLVLASSKAYVDFSTSGLENPLTHLLLAAFVAAAHRRADPALLSSLAGLLLLNRLDTLLLVAPALALLLWDRRGAGGWRWTAGLVPLVAWHGFALVYYGMPLPNTAYAKLGHGLPRAELLQGGLHWLQWAARTDPASLLALCLAVPLWVRAAPLGRALGLGTLAYVAYVVWIGGDFMGDRFLSAPVLLAALAVARSDLSVRPLAALAVAVCGLSVATPYSPWRAGPAYVKAPPQHGIVDERGYYWPGNGWWSVAEGPRPAHPFAATGRRMAERGVTRAVKATAGMVGYYGGPDLHLVDPLGLTDPLLARLPARSDHHHRVGHYRRAVPDGYGARGDTAAPTLRDPALQAFHDDLALIVRGPLLAPERWERIWALHTGQLSAPRVP